MIEINNIYKMDALELLNQLQDNSVDLIVTDPPYNISGLSSGVVLHGREVNTKHFGDWDYNYEVEPIIKEFKRVLKPKGQVYVFTSEALFCKYRTCMEKYQFHFRNLLVWEKF